MEIVEHLPELLLRDRRIIDGAVLGQIFFQIAPVQIGDSRAVDRLDFEMDEIAVLKKLLER
jgi:hypothetical protein